MNDKNPKPGPDLSDRAADDRREFAAILASTVLDAVRAMTPAQRREVAQLLTRAFAAKDDA